MKTQAKTWLIVSGVFLLGLVIGILGSHLFFRYQVGRIVAHRSPQRIFQFVERIVAPTPDQRPKLEKILLRHGQLLFKQMRENQEQQAERFSALKKDLSTILTSEQMQRLEDHLQRRPGRKRLKREGMRKTDPPPKRRPSEDI